MKALLALVVLALLTLRFALPCAPDQSVAVAAGVLEDGDNQLYLIPSELTPERNLLLVVLEDKVERSYLTEMQLLYQS